MQQKKITFRAAGKKIKALDSLARTRQCSRSFILDEAVEQYLSLNDYQADLIKEGLRQDEAGESVSHEEVRARIADLLTR